MISWISIYQLKFIFDSFNSSEWFSEFKNSILKDYKENIYKNDLLFKNLNLV